MMKQHAAFDLDGVLLDANTVIRRYIESAGYTLTGDSTYRYQTDPWISDAKIYEMITECVELFSHEMEPLPGAGDLLEKIFNDTNQPINIITARCVHNATETLMAARRIAYVPMTISHAQCDKLVYLGDTRVFVDDCLDTCIRLAEMKKIVICPKTSYNKPDGIARFTSIRSWTWLNERDLQHYGIGPKQEPPDLFWTGRIIFIDSMKSFLDNEKLYSLLVH